MAKILFIDRDGTMGALWKVKSPEQFRPFAFLPEAVRTAREAGYRLYGFTNQDCTSRGEGIGYSFEKEFAVYGFDGLYLCPHLREAGCDCRKPGSGLLLQAKRDLGLADFSECIVIGDRETDLIAGAAVGCRTVLVRTGCPKTPAEEQEFVKYNLLFVADDLLAAIRRIVGEQL